MDFGALPPEINSSRMYSGSGSGSMMAAASAWSGLASQLESVSRDYSSVIVGLQNQGWSGGASVAMAEAVAPYVAWVTTAGAQAQEAAGRARAAAAAYEAAFAATVPPAQITANRTQLANLVATNMFGQNTTTIAATEAAYATMWAQDSAAMYGYAGSSAAATTLTPFTEPAPTTNAAGLSAQAAAVAQATGSSTAGNTPTTLSQLMSALPQQLQALASGGATSSAAAVGAPAAAAVADPASILTLFSAFNTLAAPVSLAGGFSRTFTSAGSYGYAAKRDIEVHTPGAQPPAGQNPPIRPVPNAGAERLVSASAGGRGPVLASMAKAAPMGPLSVPPGWPAAPPVASLANTPLWSPETTPEAVPSSEANPATGVVGGAPMAGMGAMAGTLARPTVNRVLRVAPRRFTMPRPALGG